MGSDSIDPFVVSLHSLFIYSTISTIFFHKKCLGVTLREISVLYFYNVKQFLNGYFIRAEPFVALYVPSPIIVVWIIQIALFIPTFIIWPFCMRQIIPDITRINRV